MQEFRHIMFYEDDHKYKNTRDNSFYLSVTQSLKLIEPEVDWMYWAVYKQLEEEGTVKAWYDKKLIKFNGDWVHYTKYLDRGKIKRKQWDDKAAKGKAKGTFIHFYLENLFNNKVISIPDIYKGQTRGADKFYRDHRHLEPVYAEQIVGDDEYRIAGQIDRPFRLTTNKLAIFDFKSDEEIKTENGFQNLKPPFDFLPSCDFSKYCIQVNMYTWIVERNTDWKVEYMKIVHIKDDDYELYDVPRLPVQLLADEVRRTHKQPETRIS